MPQLVIALDTETTGPDFVHGCQPYYVAILSHLGKLWTWQTPVNPFSRQAHFSAAHLAEISDRLEQATKIIFHNALFDIQALRAAGVTWKPAYWSKVEDTLLAAHVLDSDDSHELKYLADKYLEIDTEDEDELIQAVHQVRRLAKKCRWSLAESGHPHFPTLRSGFIQMDYWAPQCWAEREAYPPDHPWRTLLQRYGNRDVERTLLLHYFQQELFDEQPPATRQCYQEELELLPVVDRMQTGGLTLKRRACRLEYQRYKQVVSEAQKQCQEIATKLGVQNLNLQSPKQLGEFLYGILQLPVVDWTETNQPKTSAAALQVLKDHHCPTVSATHKFLESLLTAKKYQTARNYLLGYLKNANYIHDLRAWYLYPRFNPVGTRTTRFSSSNPNAQNVGRGSTWDQEDGDAEATSVKEFQLRKSFGPRPGRCWLSFDYSNQELRIVAYAAQEPELIAAFESGISVHLVIAQELWGPNLTKEDEEYNWTKNGNFALIYGCTEQTADATYHQQGAYQKIMTRFSSLRDFMQTKIREAKNDGFITTLGGYPLQVPVGVPRWRQKPLNYFVQGSAGKMVKNAMRRVHRWLTEDFSRLDAYLNMVIHDELIIDLSYPRLQLSLLDDLVRAVQQEMEAAALDLGVPVPATASLILSNWADKQEYRFITPWQSAS